MSEEAYGRLGSRLRRILLVLPYAIRHPGVSIDELSKKFGVKRRDLLGDLNLVFLCGLPGYGPGDLIDVTIEDDRVFVRMADYFAAPVRLAPVEGLTLYAGGAALASIPEMEEADALKRALAKLGRALGTDAGAGSPGLQVELDAGAAGRLDTLSRALESERGVSMQYLSAGSGALTEREVDPWMLLAALGRWYLVGLDHLSGEERIFRVDRIKTAAILDRPAPVPSDFDPERYRGAFSARGGRTISFEISPNARKWFEDYYPVQRGEDLDDGWRRVHLLSGGDRWAATLVLRLGAEVRAVEPEPIAEGARALAASIAARHTGTHP